MKKFKILIIGGSGLVGSRIIELLEDKYEFDSSIEDITNKDLIQSRIKNSNASVVLHLAAKANVDGCEEDKSLGEKGEAWIINVEGTRNIAEACLQSKKKMIYISTDFVFDGEKKDGYKESDSPNPINWYGNTKYQGEKIIQELNMDFIIARISYPYRAKYPFKKDFARGLIERLGRGENLSMITDHIMTPTFVDDIASALYVLLQKNESGIFHVAGSQAISPYDAAVLICNLYGFDKSKISKNTRAEFFKGRAQRGCNLYLKNDKIRKLGINMKTFEEGLLELKK